MDAPNHELLDIVAVHARLSEEDGWRWALTPHDSFMPSDWHIPYVAHWFRTKWHHRNWQDGGPAMFACAHRYHGSMIYAFRGDYVQCNPNALKARLCVPCYQAWEEYGQMRAKSNRG